MLMVEHFLKEVPGKGMGLFAAQDIKKGNLVWKWDEILSKKFSDREVKALPKVAKDFMEKYAIVEKEGHWLIDIDNSRFFNHSSTPNIVWENGSVDGYAAYDIKAGDEITIDYTKLDAKPLNFVDAGDSI